MKNCRSAMLLMFSLLLVAGAARAETKCNYSYSDARCERASVGQVCLAQSGKAGVCSIKSWSGNEADCVCAESNGGDNGGGGQCGPVIKCNYSYSDARCERGYVGLSCMRADGQKGSCAVKGWSGSEADCACL